MVYVLGYLGLEMAVFFMLRSCMLRSCKIEYWPNGYFSNKGYH